MTVSEYAVTIPSESDRTKLVEKGFIKALLTPLDPIWSIGVQYTVIVMKIVYI